MSEHRLGNLLRLVLAHQHAVQGRATFGVYYNVPAGTTCANLLTYANAPVPIYLRLVTPK